MIPLLHDKSAPMATDHREAKAQLLARLRGDAPYISLHDDMNAMAARNADLLKRGPDALREALADQVVLLEAVAMRFLSDSTKGTVNVRQPLAAVGLKAMSVLNTTALALHKITEDQRVIPATVATPEG